MNKRNELKVIIENLHNKLGMSYKFMADNTSRCVSTDKIHRFIKYGELTEEATEELMLFAGRVTTQDYINDNIFLIRG